MTTRVPLAIVAAVLALLGLAACGTTEPMSGSASTPPSAGASGPIQLTDARGTAVTLPGPATRVVALEWNVAEHAVTLGVMPVGVADVAGYQKWAGVAPLDASVRDVGVRGEPSVDSIAALRPDLVLAADEVPAAALGQIQAFAPVVVVPGGNAADPLGQVKANTTLIGKALGRDAEAAEQIRSLDATIADGRNRLASQAGQRFVFADGYVEGGQVSIRPFTNGSQIGAVTTALGLVNAWTEPGDETYGLAQTDVEGLTRVGDATFLYIVNDGDGGDPFRTELAGNAVWRSLPFVATNRVDRLPDGIWVFGGPVSLQRYVDSAVGALTRT